MGDIKKAYDELDALLKDGTELRNMAKGAIQAMDTSGDKQLDFAEVGTFIAKTYAQHGIQEKPDKEMLQKIFDEIDTDKSKTLSEEELYQFFRKVTEKIKEEIGKHLK